MADIYILDGSSKGDSLRCAFHVAIAATNNAAGVSYRTALTEFLESTASVVPGLEAAAQTKLNNGELYECVETVEFDAEATNNDKQTAVKAAYTARKTVILNSVQVRLKFWGLELNE